MKKNNNNQVGLCLLEFNLEKNDADLSLNIHTKIRTDVDDKRQEKIRELSKKIAKILSQDVDEKIKEMGLIEE